MPGLADFLSSIFSGGGQQQSGSQQVQPIQPLAANGQEPSPGNPPSPATDPFGATNTQLATVQQQNPAMQSIMQQQQNSTMDSTLKVLLPLIAGFAQESQLPRTAGPFSRIGAALGGGANTFLQMRQNEAQNALSRAQLLNTMRHEGVSEQQAQEGLQQSGAKLKYDTQGVGKDITEQLRTQNPSIDKTLPSASFMASLPLAEQGKFLQSAITLADAKAKLEETHLTHEGNREDRQLRIQEMANANQNNFDAKMMSIQTQRDALTERGREADARLAEAAKNHEDATEIKKGQLENAKALTDLKKIQDEATNQYRQGQNQVKWMTAYEKRGLTDTFKTLPEWLEKNKIDPDTYMPKGKAGTSAADATGGLGAP